MVRTVNCGNGNGLSAFMWSDYRRNAGLGQAEDPEMLAREYTLAHQIFQATLKRLPSGNQALAREAMLIQNWLNAASSDLANRDFRNARIKLNTIHQLVAVFAKQVGEATVAGAEAQARAEAGGSFVNQLLATLGLKSPAEMYIPSVPAAEALEGFGKWLLPIGAGLLLLILLRR